MSADAVLLLLVLAAVGLLLVVGLGALLWPECGRHAFITIHAGGGSTAVVDDWCRLPRWHVGRHDWED